MRHLATYLLLKLGGNDNPSAEDITTALGAVGVEVDASRLDLLIKELDGKDIDEVMKEGSELLASFGGGGGGGGAAAPAAGGAAAGGEAPKEDKKKKEEKEEEADLGGAMDMFGGGGDGY